MYSLTSSDVNTMHEQMLTNRSLTNNLNVTHVHSRSAHEQPFAKKVLFLLNTV